MNPSRNRFSLIYLFFFAAIIIVVVYSFQQQASEENDLSINEVAEAIVLGNIAEIAVDGNELRIKMADGTERIALKEPINTLVEQLLFLGVDAKSLTPANVKITVAAPSAWLGVMTFVGYFLPVLFIVGIFWFVFRQAQGSNSAAMSFGKSKARMFTGDHPTVTFDDVAGVEEAKEELYEIVEFLKEPEKFIALGARIPKGVLLVGLPGTGKTLMAKATSGEAGVPFFSISGSEFVEMFVGVGASRVRDLFDQAKRHSPCIVFVDELDAVGRHRGAGLGGSHDEREQTLNQILVEMDGFDTDTNVIIVAATNRPDILDPALMRPGRFDRRIILDRPDMRGREAILKVHTRGKPLDADVDLAILASSTPGFVGADLENLVNEAALLAARRDKKAIHQEEFEESIERVLMGPERKSRLITEEEKRIVAYHEAGHAIVAQAMANADPVHKVTIVSRGMAEGYVLALPEGDHRYLSKSKMMDDMTWALGGRVAEELVFDDITSGASNDLERVTKMARDMVTRLGMSKGLGPRVYGKKEELIFLGREISEQRDYSDSVAEQIDEEVMLLVSKAYQRAKETLVKYRAKLDEIAQKLIEVETLTRDEIEEIFPPPVKKRKGGIPVLLGS